MELEEVEGTNMFIIHTVDTTKPSKPRQSFMCRAPEIRRKHWITTLSTILKSQQEFGAFLENPSLIKHREVNATA
ncbi:jg14999 [Pararge aegeria aegeria]|uniref:Jg14999 protein n=7 Tax=Pararge aegeria TaxID=116150 RepID=A0A8S4QWQ5_9NEOP|nr:jg14999 [Pararge aegeria aegeria]